MMAVKAMRTHSSYIGVNEKLTLKLQMQRIQNRLHEKMKKKYSAPPLATLRSRFFELLFAGDRKAKTRVIMKTMLSKTNAVYK